MTAPVQFIAAVQGASALRPINPTWRAQRSGAASAWDAGFRSQEKIDGDGFLEFRVEATGTFRAIGFSVFSFFPSTNWNTIDFGVYLKGGGTPTEYAIIENGTERAFGNYAVGDVFRIHRVGVGVRAFRYFKNGELIYESLVSAAAGAYMLDAAMFSNDAPLGGIRVYDATKVAFPSLTFHLVGNVAFVVADIYTSARRMTFTPTTRLTPGDQMVAITVSQEVEMFMGSNVEWDFQESFNRPTFKRQCAVWRRLVQDGDPAAYTIDSAIHQQGIAAILLYRGGLDPAAPMVANSINEGSAIPEVALPIVATTRPTDLYIGGIVLINPGGLVVGPPYAGGVERSQHQADSLIIWPMRMQLHDVIRGNVGNVASKVPKTGTNSDITFAFVLAGQPLAGQQQSLDATTRGAIGLTSVGV